MLNDQRYSHPQVNQNQKPTTRFDSEFPSSCPILPNPTRTFSTTTSIDTSFTNTQPKLDQHSSSTKVSSVSKNPIIDSYEVCPTCSNHFFEPFLPSVLCNNCGIWYHHDCAHLSADEYRQVSEDDVHDWYCQNCREIPDFSPVSVKQFSWGTHNEYTLPKIFLEIHATIAGWKPNLFKLPPGPAGKGFLNEATRLINGWTTSSPMEPFALSALHCMGALLLQKPGKRSKPHEEKQALQRRLTSWNEGKFDDLVRECVVIQSKFPSATANSENTRKSFSRLMMQGRVAAALRVLSTSSSAPLTPTSDVIDSLQDKHPPCGTTESRSHCVPRPCS